MSVTVRPDAASIGVVQTADAARRAANRRGILAMMGAMASFVINDALVKFSSQSMPGTQLIVVRGIFAIALLLAIAARMGLLRGAGARIGDLRQRTLIVRALLDAAATFTFIVSLFYLPLANATAIGMAAPLFISLLAVFWLRERVGVLRWLVIAVGFMGVLCVVQPRGEGFNGYSLLCLLSTFIVACRDLYTRRIDPATPSIIVTIGTAIAVTLGAALFAPFQTWQPITAWQVATLAAASVFLSSGYLLLIRSLRAGDISLIVPFRYSALLPAVIIGFVVWGDIPNALAWAGIALLVATGLYSVLSERESARNRVLESAPE